MPGNAREQDYRIACGRELPTRSITLPFGRCRKFVQQRVNKGEY